jgi:hypothetical protein
MTGVAVGLAIVLEIVGCVRASRAEDVAEEIDGDESSVTVLDIGFVNAAARQLIKSSSSTPMSRGATLTRHQLSSPVPRALRPACLSR